jgi:hypothetical protein
MTPSCVGSYIGDIISGYGYTLSNVVYEPSPVCYTNPAPIFQPSPQTTTITICTPNLTCPTGACLSSSQVGTLCVAKYGIETCPSGYPNGTTFSTYYEDTRTCGSCTCGSTLTCAFNSVLLDNSNVCVTVGHPYWMNATTSCMAAPGNYPISGVKANGTSTGSGSCVETAPSNPVGGVELGQGSIATVCCK